MYAAVLTVMLAACAQCPTCQGHNGVGVGPGAGYAPSSRPLVYQHRLWCRPGQQCLSCVQPLAPGYGTYNYRTQFNYPWSMGPELGAGYAGYAYDHAELEVIPVDIEAKRPLRERNKYK